MDVTANIVLLAFCIDATAPRREPVCPSGGRRVVDENHQVLDVGHDDELLLLGAQPEQLQLVLLESTPARGLGKATN